MSDKEIIASTAPSRSIRKAYLWLLTLIFGAHRFYVGKWLTALIYPTLLLIILYLFESELPGDDSLSTYVFWLYLALLFVDACFIPRWVRQRNEWFAQDFRDHPNRYLIPDSDDIAPWARGQSRKSGRGLRSSAVRTYFFFWIIPMFTGLMAAELQSLEVLMIPIVVLIAIGLIGTLDRMLEHQPALLEIPGVGPALDRVAEMRSYFWDHEPKVSSSFWGLFSRWKDYKPYWTLALVVAVTVVIEGVISFNDNYKFVTNGEGAYIIGIAALIAGTVVLVNLVPLTTLSFHYSLSGKRTRLRFMTVGAVAATILGYQIPSMPSLTAALDSQGRKTEIMKEHAGKLPSLLSGMRLDQRMKDTSFREELIEKMDVFLWYYVNLQIDVVELNKDFRNLLAGLTPNDEADAFEIIEYENWAAVLYYDGNGTCSLAEQEDPEESSLKFSILALVKKNTDEVMLAKLDELQMEPEYEDMHVLDIVDYVSSKNIFYRWEDALDEYVDKPGCKTLLCDDAVGCL